MLIPRRSGGMLTYVICFSHYSLLRNLFLLSIFFSNLESVYLQKMQYFLFSDEYGSSVTSKFLYKHRISFYRNLLKDKQFIAYIIIICIINTRSLGFFQDKKKILYKRVIGSIAKSYNKKADMQNEQYCAS